MTYRHTVFNREHLSASEKERLNALTSQLPAVQQALKRYYDEKTLPMMHLVRDVEDTKQIEALAASIRAHSQGLVVLGTGGSSLGGQTLCALADASYPVTFIDNSDPDTMNQFLVRSDLDALHYLFISKSGRTLETLVQASVILERLKSMVPAEHLAKKCHAITMPGARPLRTMAEQYGFEVIEHDPDVGGRYSVLSSVGLLPAAVAGLPIKTIREGADAAMQDVLNNADAAPLQGAAWQSALMPTRPISVIMPYADRFRKFSAWYKQLWAESLGKEAKGSTPQSALGAVDQHSQLQLYLDGPKDKTLTFLTWPHQGSGAMLPPIPECDYLQGKTVGDVMAALQHGTVETVKRHALPLRMIESDAVDARSMGALLMHFMLETIASAELLGINAFDQPAVEESKQIARARLRDGFNGAVSDVA